MTTNQVALIASHIMFPLVPLPKKCCDAINGRVQQARYKFPLVPLPKKCCDEINYLFCECDDKFPLVPLPKKCCDALGALSDVAVTSFH